MAPPAGQPVVPDYGGACVSRVVPALLGRIDGTWLPAPVAGAEQAVLLVLDGLGWEDLGEQAEAAPVLHGMVGGPITTVAPSTTAAALTSLTTGLTPAEHGIVGYRMRVDGRVLNVLRWSAGGGRPPDPLAVQRHAPFGGREVTVVTRADYARSGFTEAHLRGATFVGWHTDATLAEHVVRLVGAGDRFVYAYSPGIDSVAHEFGTRSGVFRREVAAADRLVGELLDRLPAHCALVVTSDHGQAEAGPDHLVELPATAAACAAMAGDARFRYLYARPGEADRLLGLARSEAGERAWVWSRSELLATGILGPAVPGSVPGRIGDVVVAARGADGFADPAQPHEAHLRSAHGSLTSAEMLVPLVAARGQR
ncbi:MAG: alkaline phosphatase family protein [Actinomycetota bacterium]